MMMKTKLVVLKLFLILFTVTSVNVSAQSSADLMGEWEGVHYYGDTTQLLTGEIVVRSSTIDSTRLILIIDQLQEGKFTGKIREYFYSDPKGTFFNADVSGFIRNQKMHFTSIEIKDAKLPAGNHWCKPTATGILLKTGSTYFLQMSFESTITCTTGPATLEKKEKIDVITTAPAFPRELSRKAIVTVQQPPTPPSNIVPEKDTSSIIEKFKRRNRSVTSTISVQSDSIRINFVDNGAVDGDSISVFINGHLEVAHVLLATEPFTINIQFEKGMDEIEVAMFAENLGSIPPNTALMQIVDGKKLHQAYLSSDTTSNAAIRIRKVK